MFDAQRDRLTRGRLVRYFESAFTPREDRLLGMELEYMGVDRSGGRRIPYDSAVASVRSCLETYRQLREGDPIYEGENLIGVDGPWGTLSLEPGGQVEWSSRPRASLTALEDDMTAHRGVMEDVGAKLGIRWLEEAVDPVNPLAEAPWMPKARYKILSRYLGEHGRLAHRMMTQTASIQCAFDYEDADDWKRKFRAATLVSPVAVALFANSSRADGRDTGFRSYRQAIWRETDPERCGLPDIAFEPGFDIEAWLDWVLDTPAIFIHRARGLVPAGGRTFRQLLERAGCSAVGMADWELHLSAIFTEVRSYSYLEVRCADLQPPSTIMAVPALWAGLLYDDDSLGEALELCAGHGGAAAWREAMDSAARLGIEGTAGGRALRDLAERIVALAVRGFRTGAPWVGDPERAVRPLATLVDRLGLHGVRT